MLISPNMKIRGKHERSRWIPWELSYSLRETPRRNYTSRRNAVLAVVLPNRKGEYSYYTSLRKFRVLEDNIKCGYIPVVNWINFRYHVADCVERAVTQKDKFTPVRIIV